MKKMFFVVSRENLKALKDHTFSKKTFVLLFAVSVKIELKNDLKQNNQLRY